MKGKKKVQDKVSPHAIFFIAFLLIAGYFIYSPQEKAVIFSDAASPVNPPITDPILWLDASDETTLYTDTGCTTAVTSDNQDVLCWADKSGNDNNALSEGTPPSYETDERNGNSVLSFDSEFLDIDTPWTDLWKMEADEPFTFFAVLNPSSSVSDQIFFGPDNTAGAALSYRITSSGNQQLSFYNDSPSLGGITGSADIIGNYHLIATSASTGGSRTFNSYFDGELDGNTTNTAFYTEDVNKRIGSGPGSDFFIGDIAEILVYHTVLSDTDIESVECYLSEKWDLGIDGCPEPEGEKTSSPARTSSSVTAATGSNPFSPIVTEPQDCSNLSQDQIDLNNFLSGPQICDDQWLEIYCTEVPGLPGCEASEPEEDLDLPELPYFEYVNIDEFSDTSFLVEWSFVMSEEMYNQFNTTENRYNTFFELYNVCQGPDGNPISSPTIVSTPSIQTISSIGDLGNSGEPTYSFVEVGSSTSFETTTNLINIPDVTIDFPLYQESFNCPSYGFVIDFDDVDPIFGDDAFEDLGNGTVRHLGGAEIVLQDVPIGDGNLSGEITYFDLEENTYTETYNFGYEDFGFEMEVFPIEDLEFGLQDLASLYKFNPAGCNGCSDPYSSEWNSTHYLSFPNVSGAQYYQLELSGNDGNIADGGVTHGYTLVVWPLPEFNHTNPVYSPLSIPDNSDCLFADQCSYVIKHKGLGSPDLYPKIDLNASNAVDYAGQDGAIIKLRILNKFNDPSATGAGGNQVIATGQEDLILNAYNSNDEIIDSVRFNIDDVRVYTE